MTRAEPITQAEVADAVAATLTDDGENAITISRLAKVTPGQALAALYDLAASGRADAARRHGSMTRWTRPQEYTRTP